MKLLLPFLPSDLTPLGDMHRAITSDDPISEALVEDQSLANVSLKYLSFVDSVFAKTDFSGLTLESFDVLNCEFKRCDFTASKLPNSSWHMVTIDGTRCSGTQVTNSTLKNVSFKNSKLELMNFRFSSLENVIFKDCVLDDVDFYTATLKNVAFVNCTINSITFANAKMNNVDVSESQIEGISGIGSLQGLTISHAQLLQLAPYLAAEAKIKVK